jgi:hypothetical protein
VQPTPTELYDPTAENRTTSIESPASRKKDLPTCRPNPRSRSAGRTSRLISFVTSLLSTGGTIQTTQYLRAALMIQVDAARGWRPRNGHEAPTAPPSPSSIPEPPDMTGIAAWARAPSDGYQYYSSDCSDESRAPG